MVNLNPSKFFDPATLADLYQVEVDYPEGVTWRGPRPGCCTWCTERGSSTGTSSRAT